MSDYEKAHANALKTFGPEGVETLSGIARDMMPEVQKIIDDIGIDQVRANIANGIAKIEAQRQERRRERVKSFDFAGVSADEAREQIKAAIDADFEQVGKIYAGLAWRTWAMLIEHASEGEMRDWHGLLLSVRTRVRAHSPDMAERIAALADLLKESISSWVTFGEVRVPRGLARPPSPASPTN